MMLRLSRLTSLTTTASSSSFLTQVRRLASSLSPSYLRVKQSKKKYSVIELGSDGTVKMTRMSQMELIDEGIFARDLFSLDIGGDSVQATFDYATRLSHPVILPRNSAIVVSMGNIKALVNRSKVIVFEPERPLVKQWYRREHPD